MKVFMTVVLLLDVCATHLTPTWPRGDRRQNAAATTWTYFRTHCQLQATSRPWIWRHIAIFTKLILLARTGSSTTRISKAPSETTSMGASCIEVMNTILYQENKRQQPSCDARFAFEACRLIHLACVSSCPRVLFSPSPRAHLWRPVDAECCAFWCRGHGHATQFQITRKPEILERRVICQSHNEVPADHCSSLTQRLGFFCIFNASANDVSECSIASQR